MIEKFEGEKLNQSFADEIGLMPLPFKMNGSKFRWEVFKMAYEMSNIKSLERVLQTSEEIVKWVNNEHLSSLFKQVEK